MSGKRIIVGPGTGKRGYGKPGMYAGRSTGKRTKNGGFNGCVNIGFTNISDEKWESIFGPPRWKKERLERGEEV